MKNLLNLKGAHLLSKNEQHAIHGGYNGGCAYEGGNGYYGVVNESMSLLEAEWGASVTGGNYCCDSCCGASWLTQDMIQELNCPPQLTAN